MTSHTALPTLLSYFVIYDADDDDDDDDDMHAYVSVTPSHVYVGVQPMERW